MLPRSLRNQIEYRKERMLLTVTPSGRADKPEPQDTFRAIVYSVDEERLRRKQRIVDELRLKRGIEERKVVAVQISFVWFTISRQTKVNRFRSKSHTMRDESPTILQIFTSGVILKSTHKIHFSTLRLGESRFNAKRSGHSDLPSAR